jgi:hypothetical protein
MPITKKTVTTYICDRCGSRSEDPYAFMGNATVRVSAGVKSHNGDIGGGNSEHWLCGTCLTDFLAFMNGSTDG